MFYERKTHYGSGHFPGEARKNGGIEESPALTHRPDAPGSGLNQLRSASIAGRTREISILRKLDEQGSSRRPFKKYAHPSVAAAHGRTVRGDAGN